MDDTFERLSDLSLGGNVDESVHSGARRGNRDFFEREAKFDRGMDRRQAKKMPKQLNDWNMFERGDNAPRKNKLETYSDLADNEEKEAIFSHSMKKGGLFGQINNSPLKDYLPNKFKRKMDYMNRPSDDRETPAANLI